jgi:hypothetical protein
MGTQLVPTRHSDLLLAPLKFHNLLEVLQELEGTRHARFVVKPQELSNMNPMIYHHVLGINTTHLQNDPISHVKSCSLYKT